MNIRLDIINLWDELNEMPEKKTLDKIRHFGISLEIFNGNYNELVHHLQIHNNPRTSTELMGYDKRELLQRYQLEITRFMHNYFASALSLTDHARNHYKDLYSNNSLFPDYQDEINIRFVRNPLAVFVKDLRKYFQHYQIPSVSTQVQYSKNAPDIIVRLLLPQEELLKFSGWSSLSKEYLKESAEDIDLLTLVNNYHHHIVEFYNWFINRQMNIHNNDAIKVKKQKDKIRKLEIMILIEQNFIQPKKIEDFEIEISKLFPNQVFYKNRVYKNEAERIEYLLIFLNKICNLNVETKRKLKSSFRLKK